jgi:hypothetical protein
MPWLWMAEKLISPQRVVRFECYCMIGLGASAGGEAGRGSAATLLLDRVRPAAGEVLLPLAWKYVSKKMPPDEEAAWRQAERRGQGDEWVKERWRRSSDR